MQDKLVSFIIPVYNRPEKLLRCVRGICEIKESAYEVVIVDDCSTDNTPAVCRQLSDEFPERVRSFRTEKNGGPGIARNLGTTKANGEYVLYVDSDDTIYADGMTGLLKNADEWRGVDMIGFSYTVGYENRGGVLSTRSFKKKKKAFCG